VIATSCTGFLPARRSSRQGGSGNHLGVNFNEKASRDVEAGS
jgi:hypothetical protein